MSEKTEILSPERLKSIQQRAAFPLAEVGNHPHQYIAALNELLADRAAFRQQVAAELGRILDKTSSGCASGRSQINDIQALATRLGLALSPASPTS